MTYSVPAAAGVAVQAVDLKPDWPKGYTRVGAAAFHLQDWKKATASYEKGASHALCGNCGSASEQARVWKGGTTCELRKSAQLHMLTTVGYMQPGSGGEAHHTAGGSTAHVLLVAACACGISSMPATFGVAGIPMCACGRVEQRQGFA